MTLKIRNLDYLRATDPATAGTAYGARLYEAMQDLNGAISNHLQQTNGNATGEPQPPPPLDALHVTSTTTGHHLSIVHNADFYRGIEYHGFYADNPNYTNAFPIYMGPAREADIATGAKSLYFGAFAQYPTGAPGPVIYFGGNQPKAVLGGADSPLGTSQGSGTGAIGVAHSGHGPVPFRSATGTPPIR